jgi:hypothetical protein
LASRSAHFSRALLAPAAALLLADTAQPSSSETQNPETSFGTESDSEDNEDNSKDEDYESSSERMKHFKKDSCSRFLPCQNCQLIHDQQCHEKAMEERER